MFLLGLAAALALPALVWILSAETRLARFAADFRAMKPGLVLLFWILVGTVALPVAAAIALGTDMPSLWALQGLFLVAILIVCGASFALERLYVVNMMVFVGGIALVAVTVAAPIHAIYRNDAGANDRTYYRLAALELTRRWHEVAGIPLPAVSGDDALAFATAFYSPDHPHYARKFRHQYSWGMPRVATLDKGWAAMCFTDNAACLGWLAKVTEIAPQYSRFDFTVTPQLWGHSGRPAGIAALMVLPRAASHPTPPAATAAEVDIGASLRLR
jgi:hypothetical protein